MRDVINTVLDKIKLVFPELDVIIYKDDTEDNYIVSIDDNFYYSDEYLSLVMEINLNFLWKKNIFNFLFVNEKRYYCNDVSEAVNSKNLVSFSLVKDLVFDQDKSANTYS